MGGVDLFFGGAKAGIAADPASPDREAILRSFVRALAQEIPRRYVAGLDMGLSERDAAIVRTSWTTAARRSAPRTRSAGCPTTSWA